MKKLVLNNRVGESGDRSVRAEKVLQQAERRTQSHRKSQKSGRRGTSPDNDDEVIKAESTRSLSGKEEIVQNILPRNSANDQEELED